MVGSGQRWVEPDDFLDEEERRRSGRAHVGGRSGGGVGSSAAEQRVRRQGASAPLALAVVGAGAWCRACAHAWRLPAPPAALPRVRNSSVHPVRVTSVVCAPSHLGGLRAS